MFHKINTDIELAWLAGLLEGEGSFLFAPPSANKGGVSICLVMTDEDVVRRAAFLMGVNYRKNRLRNPKWKDSFTLSLSGRPAIDVMTLLLPYMGARRTARIKEVIESATYTRDLNKRIDSKVGEMIKSLALNSVPVVKIANETGFEASTIRRFLTRNGTPWVPQRRRMPV